MPSKLIVFPYKMGSSSAKNLARGLGVLRVYPNRNYRPRPNHVIINWGNSSTPLWETFCTKWINNPTKVRHACNKLHAFSILKGNQVSIPDFTTDINTAKEWAASGVVVCRKELTGHSGSGIVLATTPDEVVEAPLYTKHVRHKFEFRVHVVNGKVIDFVQKKRSSSIQEPDEHNGLVRNHQFGWVFCRDGVELPTDVKTQAIAAVSALGLDFGAVDVAYRLRDDRAYVLEVNTAPGLEGTTLESYINAFKEII